MGNTINFQKMKTNFLPGSEGSMQFSEQAQAALLEHINSMENKADMGVAPTPTEMSGLYEKMMVAAIRAKTNNGEREITSAELETLHADLKEAMEGSDPGNTLEAFMSVDGQKTAEGYMSVVKEEVLEEVKQAERTAEEAKPPEPAPEQAAPEAEQDFKNPFKTRAEPPKE